MDENSLVFLVAAYFVVMVLFPVSASFEYFNI